MGCKDELNSQLKGLQARITQAENDINAHYVGISQLALSLAANPFTAASAAATAAIYNLNPMGMKILRALLNALIPKELQKMMRMITMLSAASIDDLAEGIADAAAAQVVGSINAAIDSISAELMMDINSIQAELNSLIPNIENGIVNMANQFSANINANLIPQQELIMNQAYDAWYNATIAPIGEFTQEQINNLRISYLQAKQVLNFMNAGISSAFLDISNLLSGPMGTLQDINSMLAQVNSVLAFITTQNDVSSCKSVAMRIGP
jgi:hypothetical protein